MGLLSDLRECLQQIRMHPDRALAEKISIDRIPLRNMIVDAVAHNEQLKYPYKIRWNMRHALLTRTDELIFEIVHCITVRANLPQDKLQRVLPDALAYTLDSCGRIGESSEPKFEGFSGPILTMVQYGCDDAWAAFEKRCERTFQSPRSYAVELGLADSTSTGTSVTVAGDQFLRLSGVNAVRWLIALEVVGALDRDDPWRGHSSIAALLVERGKIEAYHHEFQYEIGWPWDNPALVRWTEMGLLWENRWERGGERIDGGISYTVTEAGRQILPEMLEPGASLKHNTRAVLRSQDEAVIESRAFAAVQERSSSRERYELGEEIGRGGFGVVYRAVAHTAGGPLDFAVKVLDPSAFAGDADKARERFLREIKVIHTLQHRGIIQCIDAGIDRQGRPYLVMPLVKGRDLRSACANMPMRQRVLTLVEVLTVIAYAHGKSVLHRDLKPSNILVRESDGQPVILDFGQSFMLDEYDAETITTKFIGSAGYVPSEVSANPRLREPGHDIYSCGVMLFEVFANRRPDSGNIESLAAHRPVLSVLDPVVARALAPAGKRYPSAKEFADDLKARAESLPDDS